VGKKTEAKTRLSGQQVRWGEPQKKRRQNRNGLFESFGQGGTKKVYPCVAPPKELGAGECSAAIRNMHGGRGNLAGEKTSKLAEKNQVVQKGVNQEGRGKKSRPLKIINRKKEKETLLWGENHKRRGRGSTGKDEQKEKRFLGTPRKKKS